MLVNGKRLNGKELPLAAVAVLWLCVVGFGIHSAAVYANTPGASGTPSAQWPQGSSLPVTHNHARLVVFAHPQCPCSRATVSELAKILAVCQGKADAYVVFLSPRSQTRQWVRSALWRDAEAIPGVRAIEDIQGREALRFGAATSGQTLLYDASGRLLFNGGITAGRGHAGDNDGSDALLAMLSGGSTRQKQTHVFGCSLRDAS